MTITKDRAVKAAKTVGNDTVAAWVRTLESSILEGWTDLHPVGTDLFITG